MEFTKLEDEAHNKLDSNKHEFSELEDGNKFVSFNPRLNLLVYLESERSLLRANQLLNMSSWLMKIFCSGIQSPSPPQPNSSTSPYDIDNYGH